MGLHGGISGLVAAAGRDVTGDWGGQKAGKIGWDACLGDRRVNWNEWVGDETQVGKQRGVELVDLVWVLGGTR